MEDARAHERSGAIAEAFACYRAAAEAAHEGGEHAVEAEVLRRLAVLHHRRNERDTATDLATRSHLIAQQIGDRVLAGEALNVLAGFAFEHGAMDQAWDRFQEALALGGNDPGLRGRGWGNGYSLVENVLIDRGSDHTQPPSTRERSGGTGAGGARTITTGGVRGDARQTRQDNTAGACDELDGS